MYYDTFGHAIVQDEYVQCTIYSLFVYKGLESKPPNNASFMIPRKSVQLNMQIPGTHCIMWVQDAIEPAGSLL